MTSNAIPALSKLAGLIGDPMVRNRGTIGGSISTTIRLRIIPRRLLAWAQRFTQTNARSPETISSPEYSRRR